MREKLWNLLDKTRYEYSYWQQYKFYLEKCRMAVAIVTAIICFAVVNLSILFSEMAVIWSLLLILSGLIAVIYDKIGIADRLSALKYYLPAISKQLDAFHADWMLVQTTEPNDEELRDLFVKHMNQVSATSDNYLLDMHAPAHKRSSETASEHAKFWAQYLS